MNFETLKKITLSKKDKSRKKSIDEKIKNLVEKLNKLENYFTTSSCSGRIILYKQGRKKKDTKFFFVKHEKVSFNEIKKAIANVEEDEIWLREEPLILHVCCKTIEDANKLLRLAYDIGFKKSGIINHGKKLMIEISGVDRLDCPIKKNDYVVDDKFLKILIKEANKKLNKNFERIKKFERKIEKIKR